MEFNTIVIIVALILLLIALTMYGVFYKKIDAKAYPYTQDSCPKQWKVDHSGNCINPFCPSGNICNSLAPGGEWIKNTPGYITTADGLGGFNPTDAGWASFNSASSSNCGQKSWSTTNNIDWNGITTYNNC
jgi:hypothetical protein